MRRDLGLTAGNHPSMVQLWPLQYGEHKCYVALPGWLPPLMGAREWAVVACSDVKVYARDSDGERLAPWQRVMESEGGSFTIDARRRQIIG